MANFLNLTAFLGLNASGFKVGMKQAESASKKFADNVKGELARAFGYGAIIAFSKHVIDTADNIVNLSERLGISTKSLQEWSHAARQSGTTIQTVSKFFEDLAIARRDALGGNEKKLTSFASLGVSGETLKTGRLEDIGKQIGDSVQRMDAQAAIAHLREVGGEGAAQLVGAFKTGLTGLFESATVIGDEALENLRQLKGEATAFADVMSGPVATAVSFLVKRLSGAFFVIKGGVSSLAAFAGSLSAGGGFKGAMDAANKAFDDVVGEYARNEQAKADAIARRNSVAPPVVTEIAGKLHNAIIQKQAKSGGGLGGRESMQLNSWQRLGAAVRFNPDSNTLKQIERYTAETARNTNPSQKSLNLAGGNFGGGFGP